MSVAKYTEVLHRGRYFVLALWVILAGGLAYPAMNFISVCTQKFASPPGSQTEAATLAMQHSFPQSVDTTNVIAFVECRDTSKSSTCDVTKSMAVQNFTLDLCQAVYGYRYEKQQALTVCLGYFTGSLVPLPNGLRGSFVSPGNRSTVINVQINVDFLSPYSDDFTTFFENLINDHKKMLEPEFKVGLNGLAFFLRATLETASKDLGMMDSIVLPLAMLVLAYFVRSLRLIILPLVSIGMTAGVSFGLMWVIATLGLSVNSVAPSLMMSVMIAMSIDYALFLLTRYREELTHGNSGIGAVTKVLSTAGHTITVSGLTLCTCFLGLCFFRQDMMTSLGVANALTIFVALVINLTLIPAILLTFPTFFEKAAEVKDADGTPKTAAPTDYTQSIYYKMGKIVTKFPYNILTIVIIVGVSVPVDMKAFGFPITDDGLDYLPRESPITDAYINMRNQFGAGYLYPYQLLIVPRSGSFHPIRSNEFFRLSNDMLSSVLNNPTLPDTDSTVSVGVMNQRGQALTYDFFKSCENGTITNNDTCETAIYLAQGMFNNVTNPTATFVNLLLRVDPMGNDGDRWYRNALSAMAPWKDKMNCDLYLLGTGGKSMDAIDGVYDQLPLMIFISSGIVLLFLGLAFRSILIPLRGVLTISMTLMWVFGFAALTYADGDMDWTTAASLTGHGAISWSVPVLSFAIVIGVGLDYDIFLLSRTMEYVDPTNDATTAIVMGLASTGTIITAAGIIMAIAFSGLLISDVSVMNQLGFFMVFAVIFDTFLVRTLLVPAMMSLLGKWNWWPSGQHGPKYTRLSEFPPVP